VPHTANDTRHSGVGKGGLCRVPHIGHTANLLLCANLGPRQKKMASSKGDVEVGLPCALPMWHTAKTEPLPCAEAFAHGKEWFLCRVPWFLHTAKIPDSIFFVC